MLNNKRILITGANGFIGSHLVEMILSLGAKVRALSHYNSLNNWGWLEYLSQEQLSMMEVLTGDVRDSGFIDEAVKGISYIFHLAALIAIPYSYKSPESYIDTNIIGTHNILKAALRNNLVRVLIASTSEVYGTAKYLPITEEHPRQAQSPYSASKIGADALAMSYFYSFGLPVTIVRPFNTYGPKQSARAIIPSIITQIASGLKEIRLGDLHPTRDFNYVTDVCKGFIKIAESDLTIGKEINIATGVEVTINDLAKKIIKIMESDVKIVTDKSRFRPKDSEVYRLCGDSNLIRELTNWMPEVSLDKGLAITCNWFLESPNLMKYKPGIFNI